MYACVPSCALCIDLLLIKKYIKKELKKENSSNDYEHTDKTHVISALTKRHGGCLAPAYPLFGLVDTSRHCNPF